MTAHVRAAAWLPNAAIFRPEPTHALAVDFVVEFDRAQLGEIVERVRDGRLRTMIGNVSTIDDAVAAFNPTRRINGKTIVRIRA